MKKIILILITILVQACNNSDTVQVDIETFDSLYNLTKQPTVDLPEEYRTISRDINKPDTLLVYIHKDTIHLSFKNKLYYRVKTN